MAVFDRITKKLLDKQVAQIEEKYKEERKSIQDDRAEILQRMNKSREYRIMLREYQEELKNREDALDQREAELNKKEEEMIANVKRIVMAEAKEENKQIQLKKAHLEEYETGLRKTEYALIDWVRRIDNKERKIFDELMADAEKYKKYTEQMPEMDGFKFEEYVASLLIKCGYEKVVVTQKSGDFGADVTAEKQEVKYVIQCKYYTSQVGIEAVQQIHAAKLHYNAHVAIVATNSVYTRAAQTLAQSVGVVLWDGKDIIEMAAIGD